MMRTLIDIVRLEGTLVVICDIFSSLLFAGNLIMESFIIGYLWQFIHDPIRYGNHDKLIFFWNRVIRIYLVLILHDNVLEFSHYSGFTKQSVRASSYSDFVEPSVIASPYLIFAKQSVRASPYSDFVEQGDKTSPSPVYTGQTVRDPLWNQWLVWSDLERSSKGQAKQLIASRPWDFQRSATRTGQGIGLLTIPVLVAGRPIWTSQICAIIRQHLPWTSHFFKLKTNLVSFLGWRTQAAYLTIEYLAEHTALTTYLPSLGNMVRQSLGVFSPMAD